MMIFEHNNYRSFLRSSLTDAITKNPSFSLRAFAAKVGVAPSTLSEVLKGKKNISRDTALTMSKGLKLASKETEYFCLLVDFEKARTDENKANIEARMLQLNAKKPTATISMDAFRAMSEWHHMAILEMTELKKFEFNAKNISKKLGVTTMVAQASIECLERLNLIKKDDTGAYKKVINRVVTTSDVPNTALRNFHRQMLEKAIQSIETQSPKEKLMGSETLAFDEDQLEVAEKLMEKFFNEILDLANNSKQTKNIYHLGIQFFNLTRGEKS